MQVEEPSATELELEPELELASGQLTVKHTLSQVRKQMQAYAASGFMTLFISS